MGVARASVSALVALVWSSSACGCGRIGFSTLSETSTDAGFDVAFDVPADACTFGSWSTPVAITGVNSSATDWAPWLSEDRLELVFASDRAGTFDIFHASRTSTAANFGAPTVLYSGAGSDDDPVLSPDGLSLWFDASPPADHDLYIATRGSLVMAFGARVPVTELNTTFEDECPELPPDQLTIYFDSARAGTRDLYVATRMTSTGPFGPPSLIAALAGAASDSCPTIASDGTLYFTSDRAAATSQVMSAAPIAGGFGPPTAFTAASDVPGASDLDAYITRDGRTFVFASNRGSADYNLFGMERDCL